MGFEILEKALGPALEESLPKLMSAFKNPAIPEAAMRGTAESPTIMNEAMRSGFQTAERGANVPFHGVPELRASTRATRPPSVPTMPEWIQNAKSALGGFFQSHPNLSSDVKRVFQEGGWRGGAAEGQADQTMLKLLEPIKADQPKAIDHTQLLWDALVTRDYSAQGLRSGMSEINGKPLEMWIKQRDLLDQRITTQEPQVEQAIANVRQHLDGMFNDQVQRGWITPDRYLEDYTPIEKLFASAKGLADQGGEDFRIKLQNSQFGRTNASGERETNLLLLLHDLTAEHLKKVADSETFHTLMDDPTLNFTDKFENGDMLPKGLVAYNPGSGNIGYGIKREADAVRDAFGRGLSGGSYSKIVTPGSYVMPETLGHAFKWYNGSKPMHPFENSAMRAGRGLARWLTIYNPANTFLNVNSDLLLACLGLPGEKAHPLGILRTYPKAFVKSMKMAFTGDPVGIKMKGQNFNLRKLVDDHGISESTLFHQVQNKRVSDELAKYVPPEDLNKPFVLFDALARFRQGAELAPRVAAGVEAFERTGNINEFGRLGRESTLTYGPNGPLASKVPVIRMLSPFIQYVGLSSGRVYELLKAPGSRTRTLGAIMAMPYATYMWNTHNDEFKQVEESLGDQYRDQAHVILADPNDPSRVWRGPNGKPRVMAVKWSVPEDVMHQFGLGNMVERIGRVKEGRDSPEDMLASVPQKAAENITHTASMLPTMISEAADLQTEHGRKITKMDKVMKYLPITRAPILGTVAAQDYGAKEGAIKFGEELTGAREMNPARIGDKPLDVDLISARDNFKRAKQALRKAAYNFGPSSQEAQDARKNLDDAVTELKRIAPVLKEEHREWREGATNR